MRVLLVKWIVGLLALFFFFSCNKLSKEEIGVRIIAKVPYDNTPIPAGTGIRNFQKMIVSNKDALAELS